MSHHQFTEPAESVTQFTEPVSIEADTVEITAPDTGQVVAGIRDVGAVGEVDRIPPEIIDHLAN